MKKFLSLLLSAMMLATVCASSIQGSTPAVIDDANAMAKAQVEEVKASAGTDAPEAKYHWDFDSMDGLTPVTQVPKAADSANDGATYDIGAYDGETYIVDNGPVDKCLYLDGNYGVKLDVEALNTDEYTISFWIHATRLSTYGPTLQIGRNIGASDAGDKTVAWLNFTQSTWDGTIFPVVWNRNSSTGAFPWVYAADQSVHGLDEWVMITLVASGEKYTFADDGLERIGCKLYLDGQMVYDASADLGLYGGLAPEILTGDGIEAYIGVNYWDAMFRGFIDDMYIYDLALTDEQVAALYAKGDANAATETPVEEYDPLPPEKVIIDSNGYVYVPSTEYIYDEAYMDDITEAAAWWSQFTQSYALPDNSKLVIEFNNQSQDTSLNWNNYVLVLTNSEIEGVEGSTPQDEGGADYVEYVAIRPDWYGWGAGYDGTTWEGFIDWTTYGDIMANADVTIELIRVGDQVLINTTAIGVDSGESFSTSVYASVAAGLDCYAFLTAENALVDLINVNLYDIISGPTEDEETSDSDVEDEETSDSDVEDEVISDSDVEDEVISDSDVEDEETSDSDIEEVITKRYTDVLVEAVNYEDAVNDDLAPADGDGWWINHTDTYELPEGNTLMATFDNQGGALNWNNFLVGFSNLPVVGEPGYFEYGIIRADAFGWGDNGYNGDAIWVDGCVSWVPADAEAGIVEGHYVQTTDTPVLYTEFMSDAYVVLFATREGDTVYLETLAFNDAYPEGYVYETASLTVPEADDCYFLLYTELADIDMEYVGLLETVPAEVVEYRDNTYIENVEVVYEDAAEDDQAAAGWWEEFSDAYAVPEESMLEIEFGNESQGENNWNNYIVILSSTAVGAEGYQEYAVIRADAWGWGLEGTDYYNNDAVWTSGVYHQQIDSVNDVWQQYVDPEMTITFAEFMQDADVTLNVVRDGDIVYVDSTIVGVDGYVVTGTASATIAAGLECFVTISNDHANIDMESVTEFYEGEVSESDIYVVTYTDVVASEADAVVASNSAVAVSEADVVVSESEVVVSESEVVVSESEVVVSESEVVVSEADVA